MTQTLYLLANQNNYLNRKVILDGVRNIEEVQSNSKVIDVYPKYPQTNLNIATGDSLSCEVKVSTDTNYGVISEMPDYAVIYTQKDNGETELTRWFVNSYSKIVGTQYSVKLKRDLLADYFSAIMNAPTFVEKGYVLPNNPLIFNQEGMSFNEIKSSEHFINKDKNGPYIVGYIARSDEQEQDYSITATTDAYQPQGDIPTLASLPSKIRNALTRGEVNVVDSNYPIVFDINVKRITTITAATTRTSIRETRLYVSGNSTYRIEYGSDNLSGTAVLTGQFIYSNFGQVYKDAIARLDLSLYRGQMDDFIAANQTYILSDQVRQYNNLVYQNNGVYYQIVFSALPLNLFIDLDLSNNNNLYIDSNNAFEEAANLTEGVIKTDTIKNGNVHVDYQVYSVSKRVVNGPAVSGTIPTTRRKLIDAPYDMFFMPYGDEAQVLNVESGVPRYYEMDKNVQMAMAMEFAKKLGVRLYDLQLLPYCPVEMLVDNDSNLRLSVLTENVDYTLIKDGNNAIKGCVFFSSVSKRSFQIDTSTFLANTTGSDSYEIKVDNECRKYRLVSPNFNGIYEFSKQQNGGSVDYMNIDLHYKPHQPFIRVSLHYGGIYTYDSYNPDIKDARGLILGGDYSLPILSDAWTNYEIQNKNYQVMFNRDISNMKINQEIAREQMFIKNLGGIVGGIGGGAIAGASKGGVYGAIAGAIGGGLISGANAYLSTDWLARSQSEQRSYATDKFTYSLQNIQAIPYSLTKVSALNNTFKNFPVLEIYTATETEITAFKNKLKYSGFTIMAIGTLREYCNELDENFVQGQLIRLEDATIDSNVANAIREEVAKGFFVDIGGYSNVEE